MIDHIGINVKDVPASRDFYAKTLAALGYSIVMDYPTGVGFGPAGKPIFWIAAREPVSDGVHIAFHCSERAAVDAFHAAAIAAGGHDNGPPGLRDQYHPNYYGAFVIDPDGNNVEAVCHDPQE